MLTSMMNRRGSRNIFKNDINKNVTSDIDHILPKEVYTVITPEWKEFWNSMPAKEKALILASARDKPKPKAPFTTKVNKS